MRVLIWLIPALMLSSGAPSPGGAPPDETGACAPAATAVVEMSEKLRADGVAGVGLRVDRIVHHAGIAYVQFAFHYLGHPILDQRPTVAVGANCEPVQTYSAPVPFEAPEPVRISAEEAASIAATVSDWKRRSPPVAELVLRADGAASQWLYRVQSNERAMLVDAVTGLVDRVGSAGGHGMRSARYTPAMERGVVRSARVSDTRPPEAVGPLGNVFVRDPDYAGFEAVELPRLRGDRRRLDGQFVRATSYKLVGTYDPFELAEGAEDFRFEPNLDPQQDCKNKVEDCSAFDPVNVYYHIDRFANDYWQNTLQVSIDFQVLAVTHLVGDVIYVLGDTTYFGVGDTFLKNTALSDDFIYHEYTHAVLAHLGFVTDRLSTVQKRALSEGFADYFAATYTGDPRIGEWVTTCPPRADCDGPLNDDEWRILNTDPAEWNWNYGNPSTKLKYGVCTRHHVLDTKCKVSYNNFSDRYVWGMIWASTLWDLRERLGATVTDELVLASVLLKGGEMSWFDVAAGALIAADQARFGGVHEVTIREVLAGRGIRAAVSVAVENTEQLPPAVRIEAVYPSPAADEFAVRMSSPDHHVARIKVVDMLGRVVANIDRDIRPGASTQVVDVRDLPAGLYFVAVDSGGYGAVSASVVIQR